MKYISRPEKPGLVMIGHTINDSVEGVKQISPSMIEWKLDVYRPPVLLRDPPKTMKMRPIPVALHWYAQQ